MASPAKYSRVSNVSVVSIIPLRKGPLNSHVSLLTECLYRHYRNRNLPWCTPEAEMVWFYKFLLWDRPFNGFHPSSSFHLTLQNYQTSQNNTLTDYVKRNCSNFHSFQSGFGQNPPRFKPVTSVGQVAYRAHDAISYPYLESYIYDLIDTRAGIVKIIRYP